MGMVITMAIESDDGHVAREKEVLRMDRGADSAIAKAGLGLTLLEAKATLAAVQQEVVAAQAKQIVMQSQVCPDCGAVRMEKDSRRVVYQPSLREAKQKCHSTKVKVSISLRFTTCRGQLHCPAYGSLSTGLSRPRLDETDVEEE